MLPTNSLSSHKSQIANSSHVILNKDMDKYKEISDFRRRAFEFISQAIQCEETGKNEKFAQSLYQVRNISRGQFPRFFYLKITTTFLHISHFDIFIVPI